METIEIVSVTPGVEWILMLIILGLIVFCLIMAFVVHGDDSKSLSGWWARRMRRVRKWPRQK